MKKAAVRGVALAVALYALLNCPSHGVAQEQVAVSGRAVIQPGACGNLPRADASCRMPAAVAGGVVLVFSSIGAVTPKLSVTTDAEGRFSLQLLPGDYTIGVSAPPQLAVGEPTHLTVKEGSAAPIEIRLIALVS